MHIQDNNNGIYAGFFVRLAAYLVDIIIVSVALLTLRTPMWIASLFKADIPLMQPILFEFSTLDIFLYLLTVLYFILMTYIKGTTIGKQLFRLRVVSANPEEKLSLINVIYRETIGRYLSSLLFIGYILIAANNDKRALHDILCDTYVIYN